MDYEKSGPAKNTKCAECGSSIPAGNLSCYTCGTTVKMEGAESHVEHPFPTFLEPPVYSFSAASSSPGPRESGDAQASEAGTYYPPRPNIPVTVEQYEEKKREMTPRQILGYCLLLVVLSSVAVLGWKHNAEVREFAGYLKTNLFVPLPEEAKRTEKPVTATVAVSEGVRNFVQRTTVKVQEESPAPSATFMRVKVDGQPSTPDRVPSSFAQIPRYRQVDVSIGRPELMETQTSSLRIEVSPRESLNFLLKQMPPVYPSAARAAHVQGAVVVKAVIGKDGLVKSVNSISGDPLLAPAALDSVKNWLYRPYFRDGEPQEVETLIVVEFSLADDTAASR